MLYPAESRKWFKESNYLAQLSIENENELERLAQKIEDSGLKIARFYEPDIGNELTAVAIEPSLQTKKMVSKLPLMYKRDI